MLLFASTKHIFHSPVLGTCFVCRLLFLRDYVYLGQLCLSKGVLCFLIHKTYVKSIKSFCFVRKYAAIPVQLEIFILQYTRIGWCVLTIWTFIVNQFGCFCQLLLLLLLQRDLCFTEFLTCLFRFFLFVFVLFCNREIVSLMCTLCRVK